MEQKLYLVYLERLVDDERMIFVLGIYGKEEDAIERVNDEYFELEEDYIEEYGWQHEGSNHYNGYATLLAIDADDESTLRIRDYVLNENIYEEL